ncbi:keratin, type I cytoskeletal 19-like [Paramisgurnus dabryanus]|uniref:keratin, type I cytoskeletal 19-like n=1 Tax=Paramisgurnus dabryanus TaxID=90735 RepID=UPI003CCF7907
MPVTPRAFSVYGGAGGRGTRFSSSSSEVIYSSPADEKATMQNLDSRLASYLTKVQSLQKTNAELKKKIREWHGSHTQSPSDHSHYLATIEDLKEQVSHSCIDNAKIMLDVDNARLAAEDFKIKYEYELCINAAIEADVAGLRKVQHSLTLDKSDLKLNYEGLKEDLAFLEKKHDEDLFFVRNNAGGMLNVSVDAAPSMDLKQAITGSSEDFDAAAEKYITDLEDWYQNRDNTLQNEEITHSNELQNSIKLKNEYQKLETHLRFQHKMVNISAQKQSLQSLSLICVQIFH